eukprot:TRINITY_DN15773_c0_g1_i1.p1 TRINITY_DN15773_c0_g1~~TRINITY_DN15773_c0_g1_i1.p1  ORF type:complete len:354 (+),score=56.07 TRINITY_DN15773_c0_g1_i1:66-1127(+)
MDRDAGTATYGLQYVARTIASQLGDKENARFFVGTSHLKDENEVHLIEYDESSSRVRLVAPFTHKHEIWDICPSNDNPDLLFTTYNTGGDFKSTLWKIDEYSTASSSLREMVSITAPDGSLKKVLWCPQDQSRVASVENQNLRVWNLDAGNSSAKEAMTCTVDEVHTLGAAKWNPHHKEEIATTNDASVRFWDLRQKRESCVIDLAHVQCVRDIDYNPNRTNYIVTCGDDRQVRFWDVRSPKEPIKSLCEHSHWVWRVQYHPSYDQLLLSSGTDSKVVLWSVISTSSSFLDGVDERPRDSGGDAAIQTYDGHQDSVYGLAWNQAKTWVFGTLSYDGLVIVSTVSRKDRYLVLG